ncbi:MAG TPA: hypothetical protein VNU70_03830 [Puia sp.]|jgi:hypothetical protein|nr:hypothetical protein [Puia sp.]
MKHTIDNVRKALLILAGMCICLVSLAGDHLPGRVPVKQGAEVRYIAGTAGEVLFNVRYNNAAGSRFSVIILDENGGQLYQEFFLDRYFDKTFRLADPEITSRLTFVIRNYGDNSVQRFEVSAVNHLVEDIEVKEVR